MYKPEIARGFIDVILGEAKAIMNEKFISMSLETRPVD